MRIGLSMSILALSAFTCCKTPRHAGGYDTIESAKFQGPVREARIVVIKKNVNRPHADTISIDAYTLDRAGNMLTHRKRKKDITDSPTASAPIYSLQSESYNFDKHGHVTKVTREFDGTTDQSEIRYRRHRFRVTHTSNNKTSRTYTQTDRHGRAIAIESFREDGTLESRTNNWYLPGFRQSISLNFGRRGAVHHRHLEQRDTVDGKAFYYVSDSGTENAQSMSISTLNAQSKVTSRVELDESLQVVTEEHWQYDDRGNEVSHNMHDSRWNSDAYDTCTYYYTRNVLTKKTCKSIMSPGRQNEQIGQTVYFDYDENGNYRRKITTYPKEPSPEDTTYEFRKFSYWR